MSEYVDRYEKWFFRTFRVIQSTTKKDIPIRPLPRFFELREYVEGQSFKAVIPVVRPSWFIFGAIALFFLWFAVLPYISIMSYWGGFYTSRGSFRPPSFSYPTFLVGVALCIVATWLIITQLIIRRIVIAADHSKIVVHDRVYYWQNAEGFRLGYSVGGVERVDKIWAYQGIRMSYGPYGDDIPFMVHYFYAPVYVVLLNQLLSAVQPRTVADRTAETGIKEVFF